VPYEWQSYKGAGEDTLSKTSVCPVRISIFMQPPTFPRKIPISSLIPTTIRRKTQPFLLSPSFSSSCKRLQIGIFRLASSTVHGREELAVSTGTCSAFEPHPQVKIEHQIKESDENKAVFVNPSFSHSCNACNRTISVPLPTLSRSRLAVRLAVSTC
jgi:NAD-dependent dihydropyrimidine dehydrogenase PreA subunit